jgi:hypothetical protein
MIQFSQYKSIIGGVPPSDGNNVFVPYCTWLIIDQTPLPRLRALRVDGVVEFKQVSRREVRC